MQANEGRRNSLQNPSRSQGGLESPMSKKRLRGPEDVTHDTRQAPTQAQPADAWPPAHPTQATPSCVSPHPMCKSHTERASSTGGAGGTCLPVGPTSPGDHGEETCTQDSGGLLAGKWLVQRDLRCGALSSGKLISQETSQAGLDQQADSSNGKKLHLRMENKRRLCGGWARGRELAACPGQVHRRSGAARPARHRPGTPKGRAAAGPRFTCL